MKTKDPGCFFVLCTDGQDWWVTRNGWLEAIGTELVVGEVLICNTIEAATAKAAILQKMLKITLHPVRVRT